MRRVPPPTTFALLAADAEVVGAVVCDLPHGGRETVALADPGELVELLRIEDVHASTCTLEGRPIPDFVVTLADGTRVRPAAPDNGCHVREDIREYLFAALS